MKQISISYCKGTGIDSFYNSISSVIIDDTPFAGGGFGDVYHVHVINGNQMPRIKQVIKIFKPIKGKDEHSWQTIVRLQQKLTEEINKNYAGGQDFIEQYPALIAVPQFVFEGIMDGIEIRGYSANDLNELDYVAFDKVIEEDDSPYIDLFEGKDMEWRYTTAYHLVRGFGLLYKLHYLHADISADNICVCTTRPACAILDFDSGVIVENMEDIPSTIGKFQSWLAPEIGFQMKNVNVTVGNTLVNINLFTDVWSIANALLNILILMPPYYLVDMSENTLRTYVNKYRWPEVNFADEIFDSDNKEAYDYFYEMFTTQLSEEVQNEFAATFSKGVFNPSLRTSYNRWERILKNLIPKKERNKSISVPTPKSDISMPPPYQPSVKKEELIQFINTLVVDVVNGKEQLESRVNIINSMAVKAGFNGQKIITDLNDFLLFYKECRQEGKLTKIMQESLIELSKIALITPTTMEELLSILTNNKSGLWQKMKGFFTKS